MISQLFWRVEYQPELVSANIPDIMKLIAEIINNIPTVRVVAPLNK